MIRGSDVVLFVIGLTLGPIIIVVIRDLNSQVPDRIDLELQVERRIG